MLHYMLVQLFNYFERNKISRFHFALVTDDSKKRDGDCAILNFGDDQFRLLKCLTRQSEFRRTTTR